MMNLLTAEEGSLLVAAARQAIRHHLDGKSFDPPNLGSSEFSIRLGVFATLFDQSVGPALRGCIGNPFPKTSLLNETVRCAVEAASMDPRFVPVRQDEFLRSITVEITVLSPPERIMVKSPLDLALNIKVGRDGLFVDGAGTRGFYCRRLQLMRALMRRSFLTCVV